MSTSLGQTELTIASGANKPVIRIARIAGQFAKYEIDL